MKAEDLYFNENACEIILNIPSITRIVNMLFSYDEADSLDMEVYMACHNDDKISQKYTIKYFKNSKISISCTDGREVVFTKLEGIKIVTVSYKLDNKNSIKYTLEINAFDEKNITEHDISIIDIIYKDYSFKECLVPLCFEEDDQHNKYIFYSGLKINPKNLEPFYYDGPLPRFSEVKRFSSQQEKIKLFRIINDMDSDLNITTKDIIKNVVGEALDKREREYQQLLYTYNKWLNLLNEHKELVNVLSKSVFTEEELNRVGNAIEEKLSEEKAKSLLKTLSPSMIEALKKQLK